ncbi:MAG: DUF4998 domain-containing protein [Marinifilaceae bacterium]
MRNLLLSIFTLLFICSCGNIEDTYKDMAGDGPIRNVGKCTNLKVVPGWRRLILNWTNSVDPHITNIKVTWTNDEIVKDTILAATDGSVELSNLQNGNYEIHVANMDKNGNESIPEIVFSRPFTEEHEIVRSFPRVVNKHFFVNDRLILFFSNWIDELQDVAISYVNKEGKKQLLDITKDDVEQKYFLLEEAIDPTKVVEIHRRGFIQDCQDTILFEPFNLKKEFAIATDFKKELFRDYGVLEVTEDFVQSVETLNLNFSIGSLEDILYFPNLKTLNLAKGRYMNVPIMTADKSASKVDDKAASIFALTQAFELLGIKVNRYNSHFDVGQTLDFVTMCDNPEVPEREYISADDLTYTCSIPDENDFNSFLEYLFDGNIKTTWKPELNPEHRTYEVIVDLKEMKQLSGVHIGQDSKKGFSIFRFMPNVVTVKISTDRATWKNATYEEEITIGATGGEITEIIFKNNGPCRYVKLIVNDILYGKNYGTGLAMFSLF